MAGGRGGDGEKVDLPRNCCGLANRTGKKDHEVRLSNTGKGFRLWNLGMYIAISRKAIFNFESEDCRWTQKVRQ